MISRLTRWFLAGILGGVLTGLMDGVALYLNGRDMFFGSVEMYRAILFSIATCAAAGGLIALPAFVLESTLQRIPHRWRSWGAAAIFSPLFITLFWLLTRGPQASTLPARALIISASGAIAAMLCGIAVVAAATLSKNIQRTILSAICLVGGLVLVLLDLTVMVRLYLPFHAALSFFAWSLFAGGIRLVWRGPVRRWHRLGIGALAAIILLGGTLSLLQIRKTQNIRFVINEKTASTTDLILLARTIAPPPEEKLLDDDVIEAPRQSFPETPSQLKLPGASVLLITVDAMRYDRLHPGKMDDVAPTINALGKEGVIFDRAYTALPHTSYAVASLLTGKYIKPLFDIPEVTADQETWPEIMRRFRYRTGGFFTRSVFFVDRAKFKPLENKGYGFGYLKMEYRFVAKQKVNQALEFLRKVQPLNVPAFTWVHLFEPHEPYKENCTRFGTDDEQRYNCEIFTADREIKRLVDYVEEFYPGTIIIVSADHGEEFNDHGGKYHGTTLYDEQSRVPLLMRVPGIQHRVVKEPVNLVDILGTVLAIVDIPVPPRVRSNDLTGLLLGTDTEKKAAFSQLHDRRMVVYDNYKLIWDKSSDLVRLYDLANDPDESISVADRESQMVRLLKKKILAWEATHAQTELRPVTTENGAQSWPMDLQQALGGDDSVTVKLLNHLSNKSPEVVRQKAAELVYERWSSDLPAIPFDTVEDPVCLGWLWSAVAATNDDALTQLQKLTPQLKKMSAPWIRTQLARLKLKDNKAIDHVMAIAEEKNLAPAIRIEAIQLLGESNVSKATPSLIMLLDNYLLRRDAADALVKLNAVTALPPLLKYLETESFVSRRSALAAAIIQLGGKRVVKDVALQMAEEKPIPNGLSLLASVNAISPKPTTVRSDDNNTNVTFKAATALSINSSTATALHFQLSKSSATVSIRCNDTPLKTINSISAHTLQSVALTGCASQSGKITLTLNGVSEGDALMLAVW